MIYLFRVFRVPLNGYSVYSYFGKKVVPMTVHALIINTHQYVDHFENIITEKARYIEKSRSPQPDLKLLYFIIQVISHPIVKHGWQDSWYSGMGLYCGWTEVQVPSYFISEWMNLYQNILKVIWRGNVWFDRINYSHHGCQVLPIRWRLR